MKPQYSGYYANKVESISIKDISNEALDIRLSEIENRSGLSNSTESISPDLEARLKALEERCAKIEQELSRNFEENARVSSIVNASIVQTSQILDEILGE